MNISYIECVELIGQPNIIVYKEVVPAMDMQWWPAAQDHDECNYLEDNFITCLKEKAVKDDVPDMKCNVEFITWFNVECPDRFKEYRDPIKLRSLFTSVKKGKGADRPDYVRL